MATATETVRVRRPRADSVGGARIREALWGYGFVLVPMAVFCLFFIYPFAYAIYISFFNWGILGKQSSAGWSNYEAVWNDEIFRKAIKNTLLYTAAVVPLEMALGLSMALVVNAGIRGRAFFRSAFYF